MSNARPNCPQHRQDTTTTTTDAAVGVAVAGAAPSRN